MAGRSRLQGIMGAIAGADMSTTERKFLRRRAVEVAASSSSDATLPLFEDVMISAADVMGEKVGVGRLRSLLRDGGHNEVAKRFAKMAGGRRVVAHLDVGLPEAVGRILEESRAGSSEASSLGSVLSATAAAPGSGTDTDDEQDLSSEQCRALVERLSELEGKVVSAECEAESQRQLIGLLEGRLQQLEAAADRDALDVWFAEGAAHLQRPGPADPEALYSIECSLVPVSSDEAKLDTVGTFEYVEVGNFETEAKDRATTDLLTKVEDVGMTISTLSADGDRLKTEISDSQVIVDEAGQVIAEGVEVDIGLEGFEAQTGALEELRQAMHDRDIALAKPAVKPAVSPSLPRPVLFQSPEERRAVFKLIADLERGALRGTRRSARGRK